LVKYGILNLFKPVGPTSRDCVNQLSTKLKRIKVAHAGTLDPLAQGVLLILVGPAVRLMDEIHELDKEYVASFILGQRSPSGDLETECEPVPIPDSLHSESISRSIERFVGTIEQTPPIYSAVRVDGQRAHKLARRGEMLPLPARHVTIHGMDLLSSELPTLRLRIRCSTGTYIRTLGSDLARSLGTDAVMTELTRVRIGPFPLSSSVALDRIPDVISDELLLPAHTALAHWEHWQVDDGLMRRILDGQRLSPGEVRPCSGCRLAIVDARNILRAILKRFPDGSWRCDKGVAHWDILP
jgi:tRNA pseudouridine55 synthase